MSFITLDQAKLHLRVDADLTDEDSLIELHIDAAESVVSNMLGRSIPWLDDAGATVEVPGPVKAAVLLLVGDLYANRERQSSGTGAELIQNPLYAMMLNPYRVNLGV